MTFGRGALLLQKYIILQKVGKNYNSDIESTWDLTCSDNFMFMAQCI